MRRSFKKSAAAFTIAETLVVMIVSGILLLAVYEGIGMVGGYGRRHTFQMETENDLLGGIDRMETLFSRADSVGSDYECYVFHVGDKQTIILRRQDSLLIAEHPQGQDTLLRTVVFIRDKSSTNPDRVDSLFVTLQMGDRTISAGFAPVVREGRVMESVLEQEKKYSTGKK